MTRFFDWLSGLFRSSKAPPRPTMSRSGTRLNQTGGHAARGRTPVSRPGKPRQKPEVVKIEPHVEGRIEDLGPGKNVLIRNKYVREDTGTHDTLQILDDSVLESDEESGIDPYNTGQFDRSKNWDKRRN